MLAHLLPICPKCGYDQSGEIATWQKRCPLRGTCPECSYGFEWANVMDPERVELGWYVEHARTKRGLIWRTLPTLWYMLLPNRYWRRLKMESPRSLKSYTLWVHVMLVVMHLVASLAQIGAMHATTLSQNAQYRQMMSGQPPQLQAQFKSYLIDTSTFDYWYPIIAGSMLEPLIDRFWWSSSVLNDSALPFVVGAFGISVMWFLMFCAFPISRRRAQLRVVHVYRAMIVAGLLPLIFVEVMRLFGAGLLAWGSVQPSVDTESIGDLIGMAIMVALVVWVQWFWAAAVRIGWRVRANWFSILLVMIASCFGFVLGGLFMQMFTLVKQLAEIGAQAIGV